ncbi:MAG: hypothetical protein ACOC1U_05215 [Spirochaetota bacterium]
MDDPREAPQKDESNIDDRIRVAVQGDERPEGISESEHELILEQVNSLLVGRAAGGEETGDERVEGRRRRSGFGLVAFVNVLVALALAGAVYAYVELVPRSAPDVNLFSGELATTEAAILAEVQEQSSVRLSERERQIAQIEQELRALRQERATSPTPGPPSEREAALEAALESLDATASERLTALEGARTQTNFLSEQLTELYGEMERAIRAGNYASARTLIASAASFIETPAVRSEPSLSSIAGAIAAANDVLAQVIPVAEVESSRLAVVASQIEEIEQIVEQADARAEVGELDSARTLYETAVRVLDATERATNQLLSIQQQEADALLAERSAELESQIGALRAQLQQSNATIASLQTRLRSTEVDLSGARTTQESLEEQIASLEAQETRLEDEIRTLEREADSDASTIRALRGDAAALRGELASLEEELAAVRVRLARAQEDAEESISALERQLAEIRGETTRAARALAREADALRTAFAESAPDSQGPEMIDLLSTRVLLRAVVDSASVREEYPNLYEDMETYFQALSRERVAEGRRNAWAQASSAVEALAAELEIGLSTEAEANTAAGYLERLTQLLRGVVRIAE